MFTWIDIVITKKVIVLLGLSYRNNVVVVPVFSYGYILDITSGRCSPGLNLPCRGSCFVQREARVQIKGFRYRTERGKDQIKGLRYRT